jgi:predicted DNA-binding transcriptional regulator AlpA
MSAQSLSTLMSTAQVAEHLGIRPRTAVLDWAQHGRLPAPLRIGKAPMWEMHELAAVIDAARAKRNEATETPKPRSRAPVASGQNFRSAKELQLMLALRRANLWRASAEAAPKGRPH